MATSPFSWANDWMDFQKKYWDSLGALASREAPTASPAPGSDANATNAWSEALDRWWKAAAPQAPPPVHAFFDRLIEQGKSCFQLSEQWNRLLHDSLSASQSAAQWQTAINNAIDSMKATFLASSPTDGNEPSRWLGLWALPIDHWQRIAASLSPLPGDFLKALNSIDYARMGEPAQTQIEQFLSIPAVGHMRERQEAFQELARLGLRYQQALNDYLRIFNRIGVSSLEHLRQRLGNANGAPQVIDSMRGLYDQWIDCCEQAYAEQVETDEYVTIHGTLVNSLMALKKHYGMMVDDTLDAFNSPTRKEIDSLQRRFQQAWRDNQAMRREIEALKEKLESEPTRARQTKTGTARRRRQPTTK